MLSRPALPCPHIKVPGSIANLGPGLDTLAVAVKLYLTVRIVSFRTNECGSLYFSFQSQPPPRENRIETAFRLLTGGNSDFPSVDLEVISDIPMGAGLGSSAAATIAGFRLYEAFWGTQSPDRLLAAAAMLEGHADNAAASLLGGLAICCQRDDYSVHAFSIPWPESLRFVVLTPAMSLPTDTSRKAIPDSVPLRDAVRNMQRVLLLLQSLQTGEDSQFQEALSDRLHQPAREALVPGLHDALQLSHPSLLGVFLSGSGPSIVALARRDWGQIETLLSNSYRPLRIPFHTAILDAHPPILSKEPAASSRG